MGSCICRFVVPFLLAVRFCSAQVIVTGHVLDENNAPVAGATVLFHLSTEPPGPAIQTDPIGAFRLELTRPGAYYATVTHAGFFSLRERPAELREGSNEMVFELAHVRNTSESVDVRASPNPIDIEQTDSQRTLGGPQIFEVPYPATHDLRNALPLIPGVVKGRAGDLHFDGSSENQVQYMLDGFNISDPLTGTFSTHLSVEAVRSLDVLGGRYSPEFGKGSAGAMAIHTESGDDSFRYSATNFIPGLDTNKGAHIGAYTPRLNFSGPIVRGRVWFSDSIDANYNQLIVPDLPKGQDTRTSYGASNLLHVQANLRPANILFADFLANFNNTSNAGLGALDPIPTTVDQRSRQWFGSVKDQVYLARGMLLEFGFSDLRTSLRDIPQGHSPYVFTPNGRQGNYYVDALKESERKQLLVNLFLPAWHFAGSHQIKAGVDADRLDYSQNTRRTSFDDVGFSGNVLRRVTFGGSGILERPSLEVSSYVLDAWKIRPNLFVQGGVRQDWDELVRSVVLSPRISAAYAPLGKDTKLAAGYAISYDASTPQVFSRPRDQFSLTTIYNPDGSLQSGPATSFFTIGSHLKMPRYQNLTLGLEQLLPARILLSVNLLRRRGNHGFTYVNVAAPSEQVEAIYQLQNLRRDQYDSAEVRLHQSFGKGYEWMASYTRSRSFSNAVADITVDQPLLISDNVGRTSWDSPNRFLSWGFLPTPFENWSVAYLCETRTGFPFSVQDELGRMAGRPDAFRFPNYFNLNLHVEWTVRLFGYRFALRGGFNNITDHNNYTVVNNTIGSPHFLQFYGTDGRHFVVRLRWLGKA